MHCVWKERKVKMVTIKDVAQDAGVSVGTVSNVLNGGNVSAKPRLLVEGSINRLGYQVNPLARGIRVQRTNQIAVILPNVTNLLFGMFLEELEHLLSLAGKRVLLCLSDNDVKKEAEYFRMAGSGGADGIIGVTYSNVEEYVTEHLPFVSFERRFPAGIPCVSSDNYRGGRMAAENLVRRGAKNLLFFQMISSRDNEVRRRRTGFEEYCSEYGIPYSCVEFSEQQVQSIYSAYSSRSLIRDVLKAYVNGKPDRKIDGIFAGSDHVALTIVEELRALGNRVPEDVQVIGYDGLRFMNQGPYLVSSIRQDMHLAAGACVDRLMRMLDGEQVPSCTDLEVTFVEGGTTLPLCENR